MQETVKGLLDRGWRVRVISRVCDVDARPGLTWTRVPTPRAPFAIAFPCFALVAGVILRITDRGSHRIALGGIVPNRVDVITVQFCQAGFAARGVARTSRGRLGRLHERVSLYLALALEWWCYKPTRVQHMTAVSDLVKSELLANYPLNRVPITVIPNGVDRNRFCPGGRSARLAERARLGLGGDELVAIFVGGDWQRKGLDIAMEAATMAGWTLVVIGGGDEHAWRDKAAQLGLTVRFCGHTREPEGPLKAGDAFVLPSAYEGFALVAIEAAATGLPVLVTEATGAGELARAAGGDALPRDATAFATELRRIGADPALRARQGRAARAASEQFSWPLIIARYARVYAPVGGQPW